MQASAVRGRQALRASAVELVMLVHRHAVATLLQRCQTRSRSRIRVQLVAVDGRGEGSYSSLTNSALMPSALVSLRLTSSIRTGLVRLVAKTGDQAHGGASASHQPVGVGA